ncbi:hypothetical protein [Pseudomonas rhodesiae]|uniref:hypothetical protein n=1 Tax=Pseudomonas rhodesiae TaxID=76760 RepID=UPI0024DFAD01|nr:hypothetical protein [Pseudomonas rhodesiae]WHT78554.1 hypothetical protein QMY54_03339 [Pseudomonas rhodesiae]
MMRLEMRDNIDQIVKEMRGISRSKVPMAAAKALTFTAERVQAAEKAELARVFDRPTRWTLNSIFKRSATVTRLYARVWVKDEASSGVPASKYLPVHMEGGNRPHKRFEKALIHYGLMPADMYAVPGRRARMDGNGNISRGQIVQILSALGAAERVSGFMANRTKRSQRRNRNAPDYFVGRPGNGTGPRGIWQRVGSGARPILIFVKRPTYRRRFDFYGVANRVALAEFEPLFRRALAREMERG